MDSELLKHVIFLYQVHFFVEEFDQLVRNHLFQLVLVALGEAESLEDVVLIVDVQRPLTVDEHLVFVIIQQDLTRSQLVHLDHEERDAEFGVSNLLVVSLPLIVPLHQLLQGHLLLHRL